MSEHQVIHTDLNSVKNKEVPNPEVLPRAKRRTFTAAYKLRIVEEASRCSAPGEIGAMLRREGLFSSQLTDWRRQREQGNLKSSTSQKRGPKEDATAKELARLRREKEQLESRLEKAEMIMDVQKKLYTLLGLDSHQRSEKR